MNRNLLFDNPRMNRAINNLLELLDLSLMGYSYDPADVLATVVIRIAEWQEDRNGVLAGVVEKLQAEMGGDAE